MSVKRTYADRMREFPRVDVDALPFKKPLDNYPDCDPVAFGMKEELDGLDKKIAEAQKVKTEIAA